MYLAPMNTFLLLTEKRFTAVVKFEMLFYIFKHCRMMRQCVKTLTAILPITIRRPNLMKGGIVHEIEEECKKSSTGHTVR